MIPEEILFSAVVFILLFINHPIRNLPEEGLALSMYAELQLWFWVSLVPWSPTTSPDSVPYLFTRDRIYPLHPQKKVPALTPQIAKITNKPKKDLIIDLDPMCLCFDIFCLFCRSRVSLGSRKPCVTRTQDTQVSPW